MFLIVWMNLFLKPVQLNKVAKQDIDIHIYQCNQPSCYAVCIDRWLSNCILFFCLLELM